jgi:hypothetical protein
VAPVRPWYGSGKPSLEQAESWATFMAESWRWHGVHKWIAYEALHAELRNRGYPFLNPGIEPGPGNGREMQLIDPASNRIRFYEPAPTG